MKASCIKSVCVMKPDLEVYAKSSLSLVTLISVSGDPCFVCQIILRAENTTICSTTVS